MLTYVDVSVCVDVRVCVCVCLYICVYAGALCCAVVCRWRSLTCAGASVVYCGVLLGWLCVCVCVCDDV